MNTTFNENITSYCVYKHTCKINNKVYIGQTKYGKNPNKRWRDGTHYLSNLYFTNAIKKYGWENFEHIILKENLTLDEANYWEIYYINFYNATDPLFGYNLTLGGHNSSPTVSTRQKLSNALKGRKRGPHTELAKQHISEATSKAMRTGPIRQHMLEIYASEEWRATNAAATKKQWETTDLAEKIALANGRAVRCIELNQTFLSISKASKATGISRYIIARICEGNYRDSDKFHWEYVTKECP